MVMAIGIGADEAARLAFDMSEMLTERKGEMPWMTTLNWEIPPHQPCRVELSLSRLSSTPKADRRIYMKLSNNRFGVYLDESSLRQFAAALLDRADEIARRDEIDRRKPEWERRIGVSVGSTITHGPYEWHASSPDALEEIEDAVNRIERGEKVGFLW